jgi:hypothetical protein
MDLLLKEPEIKKENIVDKGGFKTTHILPLCFRAFFFPRQSGQPGPTYRNFYQGSGWGGQHFLFGQSF